MVKARQSFFEKIIKSPSEAQGGEKVKIKESDSDIRNEDQGEIEVKSAKNNEEGQLSVDVYETSSAIVVESIVGGVEENDINISVDNNVLTITGVREKADDSKDRNYFVTECFWGPFSRSIILPVEIDVERVKAIMKNGILKVSLPKLTGSRSKKIKIEKE